MVRPAALSAGSSDLQSNLTVQKEGTDVSQQFTIDSAARKATATLDFPQPGSHTLQASGTFACWYCTGGSAPLTPSNTFTEYCHKK